MNYCTVRCNILFPSQWITVSKPYMHTDSFPAVPPCFLKQPESLIYSILLSGWARDKNSWFTSFSNRTIRVLLTLWNRIFRTDQRSHQQFYLFIVTTKFTRFTFRTTNPYTVLIYFLSYWIYSNLVLKLISTCFFLTSKSFFKEKNKFHCGISSYFQQAQQVWVQGCAQASLVSTSALKQWHTIRWETATCDRVVTFKWLF